MDLSVKNYLDSAAKRGDPGLAERGTRIAVYAQDNQASLKSARLWSELAPESREAAQVYGALLLRSKQYDASAVQLGRLLKLETSGIEAAYARIVNLLSREKDRVGAMTVMRKVIASDAGSLPARFALAELASRTGNMELANKELAELNQQYPDSERVVDYRARVLQSQKNSAQALQLLEAFLQRNPDAVNARTSYGRLLVGERRYEQAAEQFSAVVKARPEDGDARYALAIVQMQLNQFAEARVSFQALVDQGLRRYSANYYLGQLAERDDQPEEALAAYSRVERGEFVLNAQIRAANLLAGQGQLDSARASLQNLRRQFPSEAVRLYRAEGDILVRAKDLDGAIQVYTDALAEKPKNTDLLYARAMVAARADRVPDLERDLRDILSREPENADALNALGYTLADKTNRYDEALKLIERALQLKPDDHYFIDSMGWVLYRLGRYEEAAEQLQRAWSIRPDSEVGAHLGEVLWKMGQKDEARKVWDQALDQAADKDKLNELIRRLTQ